MSGTGSENEDGSRRNPRRAKAKPANYKVDGDNDEMDVEDSYEEENPVSTSEEDDDEMEVDDDDDDEEEEEVGRQRRSRRVATKRSNAEKQVSMDTAGRRTSKRSNKFTNSMAEPSSSSIRDLLNGEPEYTDGKPKSRKTKRASDESEEEEDDFFDEDDEEETPKRRGGRRTGVRDSLASCGSPHKSTARRHARARLSIRSEANEAVDSDDDSLDDESSVQSEAATEDDTEPLKIKRILASRTETRKRWREICRNINTSEVDYGSRWFQKDDAADNDDSFEERFLIKWTDLSYLHCSWETQEDLVEQVEGATKYLATFFRKSENGLLFTADERCDGDYFDPAYTQIERILEMEVPDDDEYPAVTAENEDSFTASSFAMVMDKADPEFENGTGRQFLIKWSSLPYSESTYEFERDLILNDIEYKEQTKSFLKRSQKPTKSEKRDFLKDGEAERRKLYKIFGERGNISDSRESAVEEYQRELQEEVYKNGGQLRDYQAEGVSWMLSNFVNERSSILADEMGLGKTLQTAAFCKILATKLNRGGPILIVAPLSTLAHWYREFTAWTDLNTIVYYGTADDRDLIREHEMAYECDRPQGGLGFNQLYMKKCGPKRYSKAESPWMAEVVITTPELLVADDFVELTAVDWEVLVVDEAHRLKNHSSKLAGNLRDKRFTFFHKILLTGTPIQNDVQEFWTLLNFIDPDGFADPDKFLDRFGDMKSKERVDELHEEIRPYILRRLKEDVEKSVPPKEETLIEVELTAHQKQYYRALYEKNVKFLYKNKQKSLDGPSLNNLAMQLRKVCNHLFLLNGVEEEFRAQQAGENVKLSEGDFLVKGSGKLVLLDKLLPRLKEEGHRILIFSQFKIMLDILEDFLAERNMKFERIDGSITGKKRQQAIDRFQASSTESRDPPFIMMLSTRAGGVGINLTAADTCIIFDSDWNPQNDLQAQARCHRIGQTKSVKVYRLLTRKTYEMQMFHMSSMKMGLDQVVLKGFEGGTSGEGSLSKEEVEKLLRHGAYDIFNEDKSGEAEAESTAFVQQDIDSILERRSRTVVHDNTGSQSNAAGGTFSKARFNTKTPETARKSKYEDIDIEDPDFWKKMIGEPTAEHDMEDLTTKRRNRTKANYSEKDYRRQFESLLSDAESDIDSEDEQDSGDDANQERSRWGGALPHEWNKADVESLVKALVSFGYGNLTWDDFIKRLYLTKEYNSQEIKRMCGCLALLTMLEVSADEVEVNKKREERAAEKKRQASELDNAADGGVLAIDHSSESNGPALDDDQLKDKMFQKVWNANVSWASQVLEDAIGFAKSNAPRTQAILDKAFHKFDGSRPQKPTEVSSTFAENVWPSLKSRGWKAEQLLEGDAAGRTRYLFDGKEYDTIESVLVAARGIHPELSHMIETILASIESSHQQSLDFQDEERKKHLAMTVETTDRESIDRFLQKYAPLQLLVDRRESTRVRLSRKILSTCDLLHKATSLVRRADATEGDSKAISRLADVLVVSKKATLPHPMWTSRHDAVLIHAISKHGWIDSDATCRAITDDSAVKWGPPFDTSAAAEATNPSVNEDDSLDLQATATRAAQFLNHHRDKIEELKGFNHNLVVRAYGLTRYSEMDDAGQSHSQPWRVDRDALQVHGDSESRAADKGMPVELPTRRDLVRRAKTVLARSSVTKGAGDEVAQAVPTQPTHDFAVLDQSERCNVLLAEMLRGILKAPQKSKWSRVLCDIAFNEASKRHDAICHKESLLAAAESAKAGEEMHRINRQIALVKRNLTKSVTQSKNVVRVMLGEEPQKPRSSEESLFPVDKATSGLQLTAAKGKAQLGTGSKQTSKPTGTRAITLGMKRAFDDRSDNSSGFLVHETDASVLKLTEIEVLILSIVCSHGLPFWSSDWKNYIAIQSAGSGSSESTQFTWAKLGCLVEELAEKSLHSSRDKAAKASREYEKIAANAENLSEAELAHAKAAAQQSLQDTEETLRVRESVSTQAMDYATEPENLAKKTILLLAKVRKCMGALTVSAFTSKSDFGLGTKVLIWCGREIGRWAASLDLLDDDGQPLAYAAVDFLSDLPENERSSLVITCYLDKKASRGVMGQMAMMTKLRSVFSSHEEDSLPTMIDAAVKNTIISGDVWEKQPESWGSSNPSYSIDDDTLLLKRLLACGLTDELLESTKDFGHHGNESYKSCGLSKGAIQVRANQLARELHAQEESENSLRMLEERRHQQAASAGPARAKKPAPARMHTNGGVQTGLYAFFTANPATSKPSANEDGDSNDEVEVVDPPRKQEVSYSDVEVVESPRSKEKRPKHDGADDEYLSPSPDKKRRVC